MKTRLLTGIIALATILVPIVWGGSLGLALLVLLVVVVAVYEFSRLLRPQGSMSLLITDECAAVVFYGSVLLLPSAVLPALAMIVIFLMSVHLFVFARIEDVGHQLITSLACLVYAPLLMAFVPLIRMSGDNGLNWLFFLMLVTWAGDSGAYFAGRFFGKRKLYPLVSPGKTVEGFIGGIILSCGSAFLAQATFFPDLTLFDCLLLAPLIDIFGVVGDLCESLLKRSAGVKDSGSIFPGHGGILDRIDSLLFSAPIVYTFILWR